MENMIVQIKNSNSLPDKMDSPKAQDPTAAVPDNNMDLPLEGGFCTKIGGIWTIKH